MKRIPPLVLIALLLATLAGCCAAPTRSNGCAWDKAIYVSPNDVLTNDTAKQILAHDKAGAEICGWKRHKK